jgi:hypothetical protein
MHPPSLSAIDKLGVLAMQTAVQVRRTKNTAISNVGAL